MYIRDLHHKIFWRRHDRLGLLQDASGEVVLRVSALAVKEEASGADLALPLVIRLIVGHWDCFSRGALNDKAACPDGDCNLCAAPKQPSP